MTKKYIFLLRLNNMFSNLRKWSRNLSWPPPNQLKFPSVVVALEGCGSGFNATNSIRTCLHFKTKPPLFLGKTSFKDIQSLSVEDENVAKSVIHCSPSIDEFFKSEEGTSPHHHQKRRPVIAVENFVPGCIAVDGGETKKSELKKMDLMSSGGIFNFPSDSMIVMGHENKGVSKETLARADAVVYIPQFGTISSVNVVSCMGIMLFHYCLVHQQFRTNDSATLESQRPIAWIRRQLVHRVEHYQQFFQEKLPMTEEGTRVDPRPIHPSFFHRESADIKTKIEEQIVVTKTFVERAEQQEEQDHDPVPAILSDLVHKRKQQPESTSSLELSVFFENFADQRNLGGLVRNANAFLASVLYAGRRRINKQGTVGSDHYTEIKFFGPMKDPELLHRERSSSLSSSKKKTAKVDDDETESGSSVEYDPSTIRAIEEEEQRHDDLVWWFLDCGQKSLLLKGDLLKYQNLVENKPRIPLERSDLLLEAILKIRLKSSENEGEGSSERRRKQRLILVVPPEGGLPCDWILSKCSARVTIFDEQHTEENRRGLPSQVAAAIALHQISPICLF